MIGRRGLWPWAIAPLLGAPLLSGCGFRPLYASGAGGAPGPAQAGLGQITIALIPERTGQLLHEALQRRFEGSGAGMEHRYDLTVQLTIAGDAIAVQTNSIPTRVRLVGSANYALHAQDPTRTTLTAGTARSVDGFNEIDQQYFAADMENDAVQRRIVEALADQITLQLADWFVKHTG